MSAGYSKRSLVQKLGIRPGFKLAILNAPPNYDKTLGPLPDDVSISSSLDGDLNFIHFFTKDKAELERQFPALKQQLVPNGMIWISWPKAAAKIDTDIKEGVVREIGLTNGLVDVKVAAIDEIWSGLKFVYRLKDR